MKTSAKRFALCLGNSGYKASLIAGKVYRVLSEKDDLIRVVDESEEDYLYHKSLFARVDFPAAIRKRILELEHTA